MKRSSPSESNPSQVSSELRKHYFLEQFVVIAPKRNLRPESFSHPDQMHKGPADNCHFCGNREAAIWQTPRGTHWQVKVIGNAYPAFSIDNPDAYGVQEVVINTPDHNVEFSELGLDHIKDIFEAYRRRLTVLKKVSGIRYVLVFKNDGPMAGASVAHAHCQIFALPLVPPQIEADTDALNHYWDEHGNCAYCDIVHWELQQNSRVIMADKHFAAISPYASAYPFEVWLIPLTHKTTFTDLSPGELNSLAVFLKTLTSRLDNASMSFNYFLQESLANQDHHFVIKVEPRTTKWAGAELGTGILINPVSPEYATLWYQNKIK